MLLHANQDWDGIEVEYMDLESCFQQVMGLFNNARTLAITKRAYAQA
jgi:hypothetical protein